MCRKNAEKVEKMPKVKKMPESGKDYTKKKKKWKTILKMGRGNNWSCPLTFVDQQAIAVVLLCPTPNVGANNG